MVRIIDRITHVSLRHAERELEYHVRNESDREFHLLYLPLTKRVQNLRVFDEDGRRLNIAPDKLVKDYLTKLRAKSEDEYNRFLQRFKHVERQVLVLLPHDEPLRKGRSRIITFRFEFDEPLVARWFLALRHGVVPSLFTVPAAEIKETRFAGHPHTYQFVIVGSPGTSVRVKKTITDITDKVVAETSPAHKLVEEFGESGRSRTITVRLEPTEAAPYTVTVDYDLRPAQRTTTGVLAFFLCAIAALFLGAVFAHWIPWSAWDIKQETVKTAAQAVTGAAAVSSVALLSGLTEEWMQRYKLLLLGAIAANAAAWLSWSL
jgi:hypothetical protein